MKLHLTFLFLSHFDFSHHLPHILRRVMDFFLLLFMCHVSHGHMHSVAIVTPYVSYAMCTPLSLSCSIYMVLSCGTITCVIRHPCLKIYEILTVSESNEIRLGSWILQDDSNGEVRFIIRDLKNFRFLACTTTTNYRFTIFPGFYKSYSPLKILNLQTFLVILF